MLSPSPAAGRSLGSYPPPPVYLRLPQGEISHASPASNPFAGRRSHRSGAQKAGLAYQKRVGAWLTASVGASSVLAGSWYSYTDCSNRRGYCQPDFILSHEFETLVVVEAKLRWTADAWWQLTKLYLPVLRSVHRGLPSLLRLTVCRSYDPAIRIEEPVNLIDTLGEVRPDAFNVMVWK